MAEERKDKKYQDCLECKHEKETGHRHTTGHTCVFVHKPGHRDEEEEHAHKTKK